MIAADEQDADEQDAMPPFDRGVRVVASWRFGECFTCGGPALPGYHECFGCEDAAVVAASCVGVETLARWEAGGPVAPASVIPIPRSALDRPEPSRAREPAPREPDDVYSWLVRSFRRQGYRRAGVCEDAPAGWLCAEVVRSSGRVRDVPLGWLYRSPDGHRFWLQGRLWLHRVRHPRGARPYRRADDG